MASRMESGNPLRFRGCSLLLGILFLPLCSVEASWLYLGAASVGLPVNDLTCSLLPGLVQQQLKLCQENPMAMPFVTLGARMGLAECHYQFKYERWNCSTTAQNHSIVDTIIQIGTKETAFIYSITSAGVAHAITETCSAGNLTDCSCDTSHKGKLEQEGWKWGGCSDNIDYGIWFAETFVDAQDRVKVAAAAAEVTSSSASAPGTTKDVRALMNLHNNEVGRKVLSSLMKTKCRCHGISGSCGVRTCWRSLPHFRDVGETLKKKYENSVEISSKSEQVLRRREKRKRREPIADTELVYVDRSPNYCRQDIERGILGTRGRECRRGTYGPEGCESLCCGRGYNMEEIRYLERCHCRFIWCCEVKCKTCETIEKRYTCK